MSVVEAQGCVVKSRYLLIAKVLLIGLQLSVTAAAQPSLLVNKLVFEHRQGQFHLAQAKSGSAGLDNAVSRIRNRTGGRVLSAETKKRNGQKVHVIRILTKDGRVQRHKVDAATGRMLPRPKR